jgi:hypothetical protein
MTKADAYTEIHLWNQNVDRLARVLQRLELHSIRSKREPKAYAIRLEEIRAGVNADFSEAMAARERADEFRFSSWRTVLERGKTNGESKLSCSPLQLQARFLPQTKPCPRCIRRVVLVDPQYKSLTYTVLVARGFSAA